MFIYIPELSSTEVCHMVSVRQVVIGLRHSGERKPELVSFKDTIKPGNGRALWDARCTGCGNQDNTDVEHEVGKG